MSGAGIGLGPCMLGVLRFICRAFMEAYRPLDWLFYSHPLSCSSVQFPTGEEKP